MLAGLQFPVVHALCKTPRRAYYSGSFSMSQGCTRGMRAHTSRQPAERRLGIMLAFTFGCVFVAVVLALAFIGDNLDDRRFEILRIVLALAGGGVGGVIPGFLDLDMKAGTKWALRAGGGLAVFIVLYFWSPAHWVAPQPVNQHTTGANSPAINGNGNTTGGSGK